jgi:YHS domain-containing protein
MAPATNRASLARADETPSTPDGQSGSGRSVSWHRDLSSAQAASAVSGRPVIVLFFASWSQPSVETERLLTGSVEASRMLSECFEPVRVNTSEDPWTTRRMDVSNVPTACIVAGDSNRVVTSFQCPVDPADFIVAACNACRHAAAAGESVEAGEVAVVGDGDPAAQGGTAAGGSSDSGTTTQSDASPQVALDGYCPVCVVTRGSWVRGRETLTSTHLGRTYRFAGPDEKRAFLANPEWYAPALGGNDPVLACERGLVVAGRRAFSAAHGSRLYLFASAETRRAFMAGPDQYVARVQVARRPTAGTVR